MGRITRFLEKVYPNYVEDLRIPEDDIDLDNHVSYVLKLNFDDVSTENIIDEVNRVDALRCCLSADDLDDLMHYFFDEIQIHLYITDIDRRMSTILCGLNNSPTQKSQRYTKVTPNDLKNESFTYMVHSLGFRYNDEIYDKLNTLVDDVVKFYDEAIESGISSDDARSVLPMWTSTDMYYTMKLSDLIDIYYIGIWDQVPNFILLLWDIIDLMPENIRRFLMDVFAEYGTLVNKGNKPRPSLYKLMNLVHATDFRYERPIGVDMTLENTCFGACVSKNADAWYAYRKLDREGKKNLVNRVVKYGHTSILEHGDVTFTNDDLMSLSCYHQYIRHRHKTIKADWSNASFENDGSFAFVPPTKIETDPVFSVKFMEIMHEYRSLFALIKSEYYHDYTVYAPSAAKLLAPNCIMISVRTSTNYREMINFFTDRLCMTASEEIRRIAAGQWLGMYEVTTIPDVLCDMVPPCFKGKPCKEGKMQCDMVKEIYEYRKELDQDEIMSDNDKIEAMVTKFCWQ